MSVCTRITHHLTLPLPALQRAWNAATQHRLATTTALLTAIKPIKMLGLTGPLARRAQSLREEEIHAASKVRWSMVWYNASGTPPPPGLVRIELNISGWWQQTP